MAKLTKHQQELYDFYDKALVSKKDFQDPVIGYTTTFQHIYFTNGFALSKAVTHTGKTYTPKSTHGCLRSGYFCYKNFKEKPSDIYLYLYLKTLYPIIRTWRFLFPKTEGSDYEQPKWNGWIYLLYLRKACRQYGSSFL